jgi:glycosyltransferase involved in cell wall biosynthesis
MSTREAAVHVLVDLTRPGREERSVGKILVSLRNSEPATGSPPVRIAGNDDTAHMLEVSPDPSWTLHRDRTATQVANLAFAHAAREGADLLVLNGASMPDPSSLRALRRCLDTDPHVGFAVPRVGGFGRHLIRKIDPALGDPDVDLIPRSVIDLQPSQYLMRDHSGPCLLLRAKVVREFEQLDERFETLAGAIRELMARTRRAGFRTAVVNRALVEVGGEHDDHHPGADAEARDLALLHTLYPEQHQVDENQRKLPIHEHESLLGRAASLSPALSRSLIIDASDLGPIHNGTTESTLGILQGFHGQTRGWHITLLVPPEGVQFHGMERRYPTFEFVWPAPRHRYTAAFRLAQPWSVHDLLRLHRMALFNFVFMHDTILDDIQQGAPPGLEQAWAFAARIADGLVYNSRYTRDRMRQRFAIAPSVDERVSHLSMDPSDYCTGVPKHEGEPYVYLVGNHYPHKWMDATVQDLTRAFPFLALKTLGYENPAILQLEGFTSGNIPQEQVDRLYGEASAIVFPSLYEGFGFPVIKGLAHGRTVIARRSELLDELAGLYRGPGRLVQFSSSQELVEKLGRVLHGHPVDSLPMGSDLGANEAPPSWPDVAGRILDLIIDRVAKPESSNWQRREAEIGTMQAFAAMG